MATVCFSESLARDEALPTLRPRWRILYEFGPIEEILLETDRVLMMMFYLSYVAVPHMLNEILMGGLSKLYFDGRIVEVSVGEAF